MKIDIITRHAIANYGSLLQSYATQQALKKMDIECEIINYIPKEEKGKNIAKSLCKNSKFWNKNIFTRLIYIVIQTPNYLYSYNKFCKYRSEILNQTNKEYNSLSDLKEELPECDIFCTGSDQVWGKMPINDEDRSAYFLEFVPENKKCISYASSIGKGNITDEHKEELKKYLKKYSKILVREDTAVEILNNLNFNNVSQVLDPTLLISKDEWENFSKDIKVEKEDYILVYQLHENKEFIKNAKMFAKSKNMKLLRICPSFQSVTRGGIPIFLPTPQEFIAYFKNAKYILTDSFHGTVFSIIFEKQFINILPKETSTRIVSISKLLGINNRVVENYQEFSKIEEKIEYVNVSKILESEKNKSIQKLKNTIESL